MMKVLVTPLDWGLGHSTRLCPVIDYLSQRHEVIIAASGRGYVFLKNRYKHLTVVHVPALPLRYGRTRLTFNLSLVCIGLKLMVNYAMDRLWLRRFVRRQQVDVIISDNRFGMYVRGKKNIFLAHQLSPVLPPGLKLPGKPLVKIYHRILRRFDLCFIPDNEPGKSHLSGELSRPPQGVRVQYLGPLSRFTGIQCRVGQGYDIVALASGIEPHRQMLVGKIKKEMAGSGQRMLIISGRPDKDYDYTEDNIRIVSHMEDSEICRQVRSATVVVARAGYTTIMDLVAMGRSGIIIPTPGQTEQEHIARWLDQRGLFMVMDQEKTELPEALAAFLQRKNELEQNIKALAGTTERFKQVLEANGL